MKRVLSIGLFVMGMLSFFSCNGSHVSISDDDNEVSDDDNEVNQRSIKLTGYNTVDMDSTDTDTDEYVSQKGGKLRVTSRRFRYEDKDGVTISSDVRIRSRSLSISSDEDDNEVEQRSINFTGYDRVGMGSTDSYEYVSQERDDLRVTRNRGTYKDEDERRSYFRRSAENRRGNVSVYGSSDEDDNEVNNERKSYFRRSAKNRRGNDKDYLRREYRSGYRIVPKWMRGNGKRITVVLLLFGIVLGLIYAFFSGTSKEKKKDKKEFKNPNQLDWSRKRSKYSKRKPFSL